MQTDWYVPLLFMLLGAIALLVLQRALSRIKHRTPGADNAPSPAVRPLAQSATAVETRPRHVPEKYWLWMNLTAREKEIAHLVTQGKHNAEIAQELYLSPLTVATHLRNIFQKLKINSRKQLVDVVRDVVEYEDDTPI